MLYRAIFFAAVGAVLFGTEAAKANIIIDATFDSTITGDSKASQIESIINSAISTYESLILNNITVSIYFQEGGGLGESNYFVNNPTYTAFYDGLIANNANPSAIAALKANGGNASTNNGRNPVNNGTVIQMKSANERALGIDQAPQCYVSPTGDGTSGGNVPNICANMAPPVSDNVSEDAFDGMISLNVGITNVDGGSYSLLSTAEHEMDEVLGLGSALQNDSAGSGTTLTLANDSSFNAPAPEDLFRWSAVTGGSRTSSVSCGGTGKAYFSYGPSTGEIEQFNDSCNGDDFGDWASTGTAHVQDAVATPSTAPALGTAELDALSAIGYNLSSTPEPGTWALLCAGGLALGLGRKIGKRD